MSIIIIHINRAFLSMLLTTIFLWRIGTCQNTSKGNSSTGTTYSEDISVSISVAPYKEYQDHIYVPTGVNLSISASVAEEYANLSLAYKWSTKSGAIAADPKLNKIQYSFKNPADSDFIRVDVSNSTHNGSSQLDLIVKEQLVVMDPIGKLFLEHGELLHVKLQYKGSPPFRFCYKFCQDSDFLPCDFLACFPEYYTEDNQIHIDHYLHNVGNYTLMFKIRNVMNEELKHYAIKINDTVRVRTLPFIPIISFILAIFILLIGVALHLHYRKRGYTETADFDFVRTAQEEEEWEEEQSFIQRVRYLFFREDEYYQEQRHLIVPGPDGRR